MNHVILEPLDRSNTRESIGDGVFCDRQRNPRYVTCLWMGTCDTLTSLTELLSWSHSIECTLSQLCKASSISAVCIWNLAAGRPSECMEILFLLLQPVWGRIPLENVDAVFDSEQYVVSVLLESAGRIWGLAAKSVLQRRVVWFGSLPSDLMLSWPDLTRLGPLLLGVVCVLCPQRPLSGAYPTKGASY